MNKDLHTKSHKQKRFVAILSKTTGYLRISLRYVRKQQPLTLCIEMWSYTQTAQQKFPLRHQEILKRQTEFIPAAYLLKHLDFLLQLRKREETS